MQSRLATAGVRCPHGHELGVAQSVPRTQAFSCGQLRLQQTHIQSYVNAVGRRSLLLAKEPCWQVHKGDCSEQLSCRLSGRVL